MTLYEEIDAELAKAFKKFPEWPTDPLHAMAIVHEEVGEAAKDALQLCYEPSKTNAENLRKEIMQSIGMLLRFASSLDRYEFKPGTQHLQLSIK